MRQTLEPQQQLAHYRVTAPLGAGGMGEVYLARDETLERSVALKILPPALVSNEQRLRRFILEAKSASSLNHPNIVTIHEIGSAEVRGPDGELPANGSSGLVHYIAMEYVQGATLGDQIHREKAELRTLVGYLAQVAEGLAKAHAAGIVHRDLKPGNVMVTPDGFAKVLDFGLAKLTERSSESDDVTGVARREDLTGQGMVVGTAGYMSPEQVAGRAVDARSDIFSFGCMVYEAAARQRPFVGDTAVDTLHKILNEKPRPVEELNPRVPADLRRVIRRCLAKSAEQRYQSIKDVAIELREIADQWETLPISGTSDSGAAAAAAGAAVRRPGRRWLRAGAAAAALVVGTAAIAWFLVPRLRTDSATGGNPLETVKITSIVSGYDLSEPELSPDGRYLAYVKTGDGRFSILVRQVATGSDVPVVGAQQMPLARPGFSPDGNYLYYLSAAESDPAGIATLFAVPSIGGPPRKIARDVDSVPRFSPDGKRFAFFRGWNLDESKLLVFDLTSGVERLVATFKTPPDNPVETVAWSRDGRKILAAFRHSAGRETGDLQAVAFDAETGDRAVIGTAPGLAPWGAAWLPGDRLAVAGFDPTRNTMPQLWQVQFPGGTRHRVTNDQSAYLSPSASADGTMVAAIRTSATRALWSIGASRDEEPRQVPLEATNPNQPQATADGTIVFGLYRDDKDSLWSVRPDGVGLRRITPETLWAVSFLVLPGKNAVVFNGFGADLLSHIWRMDIDGGNLTQLTRGGDELLLDVSPDGRECLFRMKNNAAGQLWRQALDGTAAAALVAKESHEMGIFSPNGRLVAHWRYEWGAANWRTYVEVIPREGGSPVATLEAIRQLNLVDWAGDSSALAYLTDEGGVQTLMRWPIKGGPATPVFRFSKGRIQSFRWSRDGREVLFAAETGRVANLWRWRVGTAAPQQITRFPSGQAGSYSWSPDGKTIYFIQGHQTRDIVLIRGIK